MKIFKYLLTSMILMFSVAAFTQNVVTTNINSLALKPYTAAQRMAITNPKEGMVVYQSDGQKGIYFYTVASGWIAPNSSMPQRYVKAFSNKGVSVLDSVVVLLAEHAVSDPQSVTMKTSTGNTQMLPFKINSTSKRVVVYFPGKASGYSGTLTIF